MSDEYSYQNEDSAAAKRTRVSQIYNTKRFEEGDMKKLKKKARVCRRKCLRNSVDPWFYINLIMSRIPIFNWLPKYQFKYLIPDAIAGITVGIMVIPQGMADALLATLPAANGLYIAFFPSLFYAVFGTSPHLHVGPIALVSLLSGVAIEKQVIAFEATLNASDLNSTHYIQEIADYRLTVATSLTVLVGFFQFMLGFSGLGIITSYFSDTFISSYTCASAIHVINSQIKDLFGIPNAKKFHGILNVPRSIYDLCTKLPNSNYVAVIISVSSILYLVIFKEYINPLIKKKFPVPFPSELFLVVIATSISYFGNLHGDYKITIVGDIPSGFPGTRVPEPSLWPKMITDAIIISLIAFSISISMVCLFARKHKTKVDTTQELYAYGIANMASSMLTCYPSAGSLSRSSVIEGAGAKTMLSALFGAVVLFFVILFMGPLFECLPKAVLASIIVAAFKNILLQSLDMFRLWKINKYESIVWFVTFVSVVFMDVDYGLAIGAGISMFLVVIKDQFFNIRSLAKYDETSEYADENFILKTEPVNGAKIIKVQRSIYYVNCQSFQNKLFKFYGLSPIERLQQIEADNLINPYDEEQPILEKLEDKLKLPDIILDFSAVNYIDTNGVKLLMELVEDFKKIDVKVYICESQDSFIEILHHMKFLEKLDENIYVKISDAMSEISRRKMVN